MFITISNPLHIARLHVFDPLLIEDHLLQDTCRFEAFSFSIVADHVGLSPLLGKWHRIIYYPIISRWHNNTSDFLTTEATVTPMNIRHCLLLSWPHVPVSLGRLCVIQRLPGLLSTESDWWHRMLLKRLATPLSSPTAMALTRAEWKDNYFTVVQITLQDHHRAFHLLFL